VCPVEGSICAEIPPRSFQPITGAPADATDRHGNGLLRQHASVAHLSGRRQLTDIAGVRLNSTRRARPLSETRADPADFVHWLPGSPTKSADFVWSGPVGPVLWNLAITGYILHVVHR